MPEAKFALNLSGKAEATQNDPVIRINWILTRSQWWPIIPVDGLRRDATYIDNDQNGLRDPTKSYDEGEK